MARATFISSGDGGAGVPSGSIIMWSGSIANIPDGWVLCDGTNDTPDLRNRFVVGAGDSYAVDDTGGSDSVTLTTGQLPAHNHTVNNGGSQLRTTVFSLNNLDFDGSFQPIETVAITTANAGSGESHENRPPFYALALIMKT